MQEFFLDYALSVLRMHDAALHNCNGKQLTAVLYSTSQISTVDQCSGSCLHDGMRYIRPL
jgi:hypothetical protein